MSHWTLIQDRVPERRLRGNVVRRNWTDTPNSRYLIEGRFDTFEDNVLVEDRAWPAEARAVIGRAGLQAPWDRRLRSLG